MGIFDFLDKLYNQLKPALAQIGSSPIAHSARRGIAPFEWVGKKAALVVNSLLLTIVYFTVFGATAIVAKIMKKKFMELNPDKTAKSYWMERKKEDYGKKETYRGY